jgi:uncharacterized protein (TIGR02246 family)
LHIDPKKLAKLAEDYTAAWNSKSPDAVASFFAQTGGIIINNGTPWQNCEGVAAMASGFYADVPDLHLTCDAVRAAGSHVLYMWTFTGHDATTGNPLTIRGWEEWDVNDDLTVQASRGWFDSDDYARQVQGA